MSHFHIFSWRVLTKNNRFLSVLSCFVYEFYSIYHNRRNMKAPPSNCLDCPLARPLYSVGVASPLENRFSCGNSLDKVVRSYYPSTAECRDAVRDLPHHYFQPLPLPDLQGLDPEWICDRIHLSLNWLDVYDDAPEAKDGEIAVEVCHHDLRIGYLRRSADLYYCDRLVAIGSPNPYWLALHLVHPDYLHKIPDEIAAARALTPDYF